MHAHTRRTHTHAHTHTHTHAHTHADTHTHTHRHTHTHTHTHTYMHMLHMYVQHAHAHSYHLLSDAGMNICVCIQVIGGHQRLDGILEDFCDFPKFKSHPLFGTKPNALQVLLFLMNANFATPLALFVRSTSLVSLYYYNFLEKF